jgi:hypothetical protein
MGGEGRRKKERRKGGKEERIGIGERLKSSRYIIPSSQMWKVRLSSSLGWKGQVSRAFLKRFLTLRHFLAFVKFGLKHLG